MADRCYWAKDDELHREHLDLTQDLDEREPTP